MLFEYAKFEVLIIHANGNVESAVGYTSLEFSGAVRLGI